MVEEVVIIPEGNEVSPEADLSCEALMTCSQREGQPVRELEQELLIPCKQHPGLAQSTEDISCHCQLQ